MYRVLTKGGIISPNELLNIVLWTKKNNINSILLGSRQDILIDIKEDQLQNFESALQTKISIIKKNSNSNISSSYVASDIFDSRSWLTSASYLYILESIQHQPTIKINIVDPLQNLVPLFYADINFIASDIEEYWYLYIKNPHWDTHAYYPSLINSKDIHVFSKEIEQHWDTLSSSQELFDLLSAKHDTDNRSIQKTLQSNISLFPYYEGMHRYGIDKFWLGLYRRKNTYKIKVLQSLAEQCIKDGIANICITPWKSFVIKGIPSTSKLAWEYMLGSQGINVRHSQLEMNWHLPANDFIAMMAKQKIVGELQRRDISTYGLTFGIYKIGRDPFTSIAIIKKQSQNSIKDAYDILKASDFDPASQAYSVYAQDITIDAIPDLLVEICKRFYTDLQSKKNATPTQPIQNITNTKIMIHQCEECLSIYDPKIGDSVNGILPSVKFSELSSSYTCGCCSAPKSSFSLVEVTLNTEHQ